MLELLSWNAKLVTLTHFQMCYVLVNLNLGAFLIVSVRKDE